MVHFKRVNWVYELYLKAVNLKNKLFGILNTAVLVVLCQDRLCEHLVHCIARN